jgi:hypothetical protein
LHYGFSPNEILDMTWPQIIAYIKALNDMASESAAPPPGAAKGFRPLSDAEIIESAREKGIL